MAKNIGNHTFNFGINFYNWMNKFDHISLVRNYCGRSNYRNLYLMLQVYDPTNYTKTFIDNLIEWQKEIGSQEKYQFIQERETIFAIVNGSTDNKNGFLMDNYLDSVGPRTHYILEGEGEFKRLDEYDSVTYSAGDLIVFDKLDFGKRWIHNGSKGHQLVTCWSNSISNKRNWQLFSEYEKKYNIKEARQ